jgi:hypothetical protein
MKMKRKAFFAALLGFGAAETGKQRKQKQMPEHWRVGVGQPLSASQENRFRQDVYDLAQKGSPHGS